ncbi:MAG: hypothetical protein BAJALOKI2v1_100004 [Promethearchaeota archaeon]|nr:MAG: hypothetical protein BAJALOKI2v1_100004 [Candidatus Lokiarchaeota archaeon]
MFDYGFKQISFFHFYLDENPKISYYKKIKEDSFKRDPKIWLS